MEKCMGSKIYSPSLDCFPSAHMQIVWDVAWARAGEESFGNVLVSGCLAACSEMFASALGPENL